MKDYIRNRVLKISNYVLLSEDTARGAAKKFLTSKSTVHTDLSKRLSKIDPLLYAEIQSIFKENKRRGELLGGEMTKQRYKGKVMA